MKNSKERRIRRSQKTRIKIAQGKTVRLSIHRTNLHIYAQLIDDNTRKTITQASTLEPEIKNSIANGSNIAAAMVVGKRIAEKGKEKGVLRIAFDRSGYRYHGRVKALAEAARQNGLIF